MMAKWEITIRNPVDIIDARMKVREAARHFGFGLTDQAIISMTTYMVANNLGLGKFGAPNGLIQVRSCQKGNSIGIQVTCSQAGYEGNTFTTGYYKKLVDEVDMRRVNPDIFEVTLTMWSKF